MKTNTVCSVLLATIMMLILCGCGGDETTSDSYATTSIVTTTTDTTTITTEATTTTTTIETTTTTAAKPTSTTKKPTIMTKATTTARATTTTQAATTKPVKKSWFDEHGFKITPLTEETVENFCMNKDESHICTTNKMFGVVENGGYFGDRPCETDGCKDVVFYRNTSCASNETVANGGTVVAFDRYTGYVFVGCDSESGNEINIDGKTIFAEAGNGLWGGIYEHCVTCTVDYDGVVFLLSPDIKTEKLWDDKIHTIDEFIDFDTAEYYFFSASNK